MINNQPKIDIPKSLFERLFDGVAFVFLMISIAYLISQYGGLPEKVPAHFNGAGEVDRYGNKIELIMLPIIAAAIWIGMTVLERYPHTFNYMNLTKDNVEAQYKNGRLMLNVLKNEVVLLFSYLTYQTTQISKGLAEGIDSFFMPVFLIVIFGSLAFFFVRMLRL